MNQSDNEQEFIDADIVTETQPSEALQKGAQSNMQLAIAGALEWTPETLQKQIEQEKQMRSIIVQYTKDAMIEGHHYYKITKDGKPAVSKEGAYNLRSLFKVTPGPREIKKEWHGDGHLTVTARSPLYDRAGNLVATGDGLATTRESKWAYRNAERVCPDCAASAIIKGKAEYGGGWLCWKTKGGCGAKFAEKDPAIIGQEIGKVDNENLADLYNTVLKIAGKRADVDAALQLPLVSELFTQDVDESHIAAAVGIKQQAAPPPDDEAPPAQTNRQKTGQAVKEAAKRQSTKSNVTPMPTHSGPPQEAPTVEAVYQAKVTEHFGTSGAAFKRSSEIMDVCRKLNESGHATKWTFDNLESHVQENLDKAIKQLDEGEVEVLISDLTAIYDEWMAIKGENATAAAPEAKPETAKAAPAPKGTVQPTDDEPAIPSQVDALRKMCDIKDTTEIEVMLKMFPGGEKSQFEQLTFGEGKKAITVVTNWQNPVDDRNIANS